MIGKLDTTLGTVDFFGKNTTLNKVEECLRIASETIDALDKRALQELSSGYTSDLDKIFDAIVLETYDVLYGSGKTEVKETSSIYLDKLSETFEEQLRIDNLNYFVSSVFPDVEMSWHHIEWSELIQKYARLAILASRDHGKSFWFSNMYPIWRLYRYNAQSKRKDIRLAREGFIFSHTKDKAIHNLEVIQDTIRNNSLLNEKLYKREGFIKTELKTLNGGIIRVKGLFGTTRGFHPYWIVADDILNDKMLYSQGQREKAIDYFYSVLENMVVPQGQLISVGTPFHQKDLYGTFKDKDRQKVWAYREYPAIFPDGRVLWPNRYDYKALLRKRDINGNLRFTREFLCRPVATDSSIFPWNELEKATRGMNGYTLVNNIEAFPIKFKSVVCGCDFAISERVGADYTVFSVWGIDHDNCMWLLHVWRKLGASFNEQVSYIKTIHANFRPNVIVMEKNNFQNIYVQHFKNSSIPVKPHNTGVNKADIKNGVPGLSIQFERGKFKFPRGNKESIDVTDNFLVEFNNVTYTEKGIQAVGSHDDCVMSTWFGKLAAEYSEQGQFNFDFL